MSLRVGALCAGYGGLELAVGQVLADTQLAWYAEYAKAPAAVMAYRWPGVPNLGDMTAVDWATVPPVDVLTGGTPCQDLSKAGRRAGMRDGTRSNLWVAMREAIANLRPKLVIWENVSGAYSAAADSAVEPCPGCVGDRPGVLLRALGRVCGDLSELRYDTRWHGLRASDIGAPHERFRVFLTAYPSDSTPAAFAGHLASQAGQKRWTGHPHHSPTNGRYPVPEARPTHPQIDAGWADTSPAIRRWQRATGYRAPKLDAPYPQIAEWCMGLPPGWVTGVPGLSENQQAIALGNGVVPQQAAAALTYLLSAG